MATLKYKVITSKIQCKKNSNVLEQLIFSEAKNRNTNDEIALLTVLIEKWDVKHNSFEEVDPIRLLHSLMQEHNLETTDVAEILDISKVYVSRILNYKKGLSKDIICKLTMYFKESQEAFNRSYKFVVPCNSRLRNGSVMNTKKKLVRLRRTRSKVRGCIGSN